MLSEPLKQQEERFAVVGNNIKINSFKGYIVTRYEYGLPEL